MDYQTKAIGSGSYVTATSAPVKMEETLTNRLKSIQATLHSCLNGSEHLTKKLYGNEPETSAGQVQPASPETLDEITRTIDILSRRLEERIWKTGDRL